MKTLMIGLMILPCAIAACGETFQMDRKGDAVVEVIESSGEYKITCKFTPQTKFDPAVNAKFNDAKGDSLCKKGLARYLKVGTNEALTVSGLYSVAPVEKESERLCYSFGVPVSGCSVNKVVVKPKPSASPSKPVAAVATLPTPNLLQPTSNLLKPASNLLQMPTPNLLPTSAPNLLPSMTNVVPPKSAQEVKPTQYSQPKTASVVTTSSYLCVARYREVNGARTTISHNEYRGRSFKNPKEFDQFCRHEFARIQVLGDANLRAVRNFGK